MGLPQAGVVQVPLVLLPLVLFWELAAVASRHESSSSSPGSAWGREAAFGGEEEEIQVDPSPLTSICH